MPQFDINTLDYTTDELNYFKTELKNFKLPWITKIWKKYGVKILRSTFLPAMIIMMVFGIIYNETNFGQYDWIWIVNKTIILFFILGFGSFALISHIVELIKTNKLRRRLGLTKTDFNILINLNQITGM